MEAKLFLSYLEETHLFCYPPKPADRTALISASAPLRTAEVLCQCLYLMVGKHQSSLMWLSAPQAQPVCFQTHRTQDGARHKRRSVRPRLRARARHRHPIKALGTPCSELSQLGCVWAQIFEQRSAARVPLAEHHRIPRPKQKFGGGEVGVEGLWMLGMCITHVYTQVSSVSLLLTSNFSGGVDKV